MDVSNSPLGPPLVSIVITNYNYGRFLEDAVASVLAQSYPHIECVVVDDASTDDSRAILEDIQRRAPSVAVLCHPTNLGQASAFRTGFAATAGEYVVFLDADDILLPQFVETHIFVHLSSRVAVGFTSSDMLQAKGAHVVTSCWGPLSSFVVSRRGVREGLLRRIDASAPELWTMKSAQLDGIESRVHLVDITHDWGEWVYAPTSGNCFRRDALDLFLGDHEMMEIKYHGDTYLNKAVCLLSGAILIDLPLAVYRIHDKNGFASHPELFGVFGADMKQAARGDHHAWRAAVDRLIDGAGLFVQRIGLERYSLALVRLQAAGAEIPPLPEMPRLGGYIEAKLLSSSTALQNQIGESDFQVVLEKINAVRRQSIEKSPAPRPWLKHFAEFFLTVGRAFNAPTVSKAGEWLWHL
jgi:glycosyltransferase involved in cell wall biosynthesis